MHINCPSCFGKAIIGARKNLDIKLAQLYCSCKDPECGHTFVMDLSFSHTLSPSSRQAQNMVVSMLRSMPEAERQGLLALVQG